LQTENADLLRQLEEVRGKVSLVMEEKAELAGELDSAKGQIKRVDDQVVKRLEEELQASASRIQALTRQLADLQAAYASSQKERGEARRTPSAETPPLSRTSNVNRTVDAILPANVRHKRQVSLTALKARMGSSFTRGGMESLAENPGERKQFGDEIMFCCPACEGDLITL
jgi:septal ring factor EnvC (AmiA/AmiB activator)